MNFNVFHINSTHELTFYLYDVGHGDCMLITDGDESSLLVDVGSWRSRQHPEVPIHLSKVLRGKKNALMISHYHIDHYNLLSQIWDYRKLFGFLYVPDLPLKGPGSDLAEFVTRFLELAVHTNYSYYWNLPSVLKNSGISIIPLHKGLEVYEVGHRYKTLWPDFTSILFFDKETVAKSYEALSRLYEAVDDLEIDYPFYYGENIEGFFRHLAEICSPETSRPYHENIQNVLKSVENTFSEVANLFSLVVSSYYQRTDRMLLLGDAPDEVLDEIYIPGGIEFNLIKSSHHGTTFGWALDGLHAKYLTISRSKRERSDITNIHPSYYQALSTKKILSTEHLGHCIIL